MSSKSYRLIFARHISTPHLQASAKVANMKENLLVKGTNEEPELHLGTPAVAMVQWGNRGLLIVDCRFETTGR